MGTSSPLLAAAVIGRALLGAVAKPATKAGAGAEGGLAPAWGPSRLSYRTNRKMCSGRECLFLRPPVVEAL